jgi:hypothetical protein
MSQPIGAGTKPTSQEPLTDREAYLIARFLAGGPESDSAFFTSDVGQRVYHAMRFPGELTRDQALDLELNRLPAEEGDAFRQLIMAQDPEREPGADDVERVDSPPQLDPAALSGLAGDVVRAIEPHTEADAVALLMSFLVAFGCAAGRTAHALADGSRHGLNLFAVIVARTAKGRKGSSWARVRQLMERVDPEWAQNRVLSGLSTGEGLINAVRDPIAGRDAEDDGVADKRLLTIEEEFAGTLKVAMREGNTLSPTLRQAWDRGELHVLTRGNPLHATGAHISVVGHITRDELLRYLTETEYASGYANRFLWIYARRSKLLPDGGGEPDFRAITPRLQEALSFAWGHTTPIVRDLAASALWRQTYESLSQEREGLLGALTARAEAHTLRLSIFYAVLDCSPVVREEHLQAALALWQYADDSAAYIFGDRCGDPIAERIRAMVHSAGGDGLSRSAISNRLGRNVSAKRLDAALRLLEEQRSILHVSEPTVGRSATVYHAR